MAVQEATRNLTLRQKEGRAINAVAELFEKKLSVPNIYLEPKISVLSADVLAVDRGGAGALHAVLIKHAAFSTLIGRTALKLVGIQLPSIHRQIMAMPAHFRYLAIPAAMFDPVWNSFSKLGFFSEDGMGKIGIITIKENGDSQPIAELAVPAERFRVDPAKLKAIETKLLDKSRPDIEVRI